MRRNGKRILSVLLCLMLLLNSWPGHVHGIEADHDHTSEETHVHTDDCGHDHTSEETHVHTEDCGHDHASEETHVHTDDCGHDHTSEGTHVHTDDTAEGEGDSVSLFDIAYEDGFACEFCDGYLYGDWPCDGGDHCGPNSDRTDCYEAHHCGDCGDCHNDSGICDTCGNCEEHCECEEFDGKSRICVYCDTNFGQDGEESYCGTCACCEACYDEYHCGSCSDCMEEGVCEECGWCDDCADGVYHCTLCGICCYPEDGYACDYCGYCESCFYDTHCTECGECDPERFCYSCDRCNSCCMLCEDCDICVDCADEFCEFCCLCGDHTTVCGDCGIYCEACSEDGFCDVCGYCAECAVMCAGCGEVCGDCTDDWCLSCGNCLDCAGAVCEDCGESCLKCCTAGEEFCESCSLCLNCTNICLNCYGTCSNCELVCSDCNGACNACSSGAFCTDCGRCEQCAGSFCLNCGSCEECATVFTFCGEHCDNCVEPCSYCGECTVCEEGCPDCGRCAYCMDGWCQNCGRCGICAVTVFECGVHCAMCSDGCEDESCEHCIVCENLLFCLGCGKCEACADGWCDKCEQCGDCVEVFDCGDHCSNCATYCPNESCLVCNACAGEASCPGCGLCSECNKDYCEGCNRCGTCSYNSLFDCGIHCGMCSDGCSIDSCTHCSVCESLEFCNDCGRCEACADGWCDKCGLCGNCTDCFECGEHCSRCATFCSNAECGLCIACLGEPPCPGCGLCSECNKDYCEGCNRCGTCNYGVFDCGMHCAMCSDGCSIESCTRCSVCENLEFCNDCGRCEGCADGWCDKCGLCGDCTDCFECGEHCSRCASYCPSPDCLVCNSCTGESSCPGCGLCSECNKDYCEGCNRCGACNYGVFDCGMHCAMCSDGCSDESCTHCSVCENLEFCYDCGQCQICEGGICETCGVGGACTTLLPCKEHCSSCAKSCTGCGKCLGCNDNYCESCLLCSDCTEVCSQCFEHCVKCEEKWCESCHSGNGCVEFLPCGHFGSMCKDCAEDDDKICVGCGQCFQCVDFYYCENCKLCLNNCTTNLCGSLDGCNNCKTMCTDCNRCEDCCEWFCSDCGKCSECAKDRCDVCGECSGCAGEICKKCNATCAFCVPRCSDCGNCLSCTENHCPACKRCADCTAEIYCTSCGACSECVDLCTGCGNVCSKCTPVCSQCKECEGCTGEKVCPDCKKCADCTEGYFCWECGRCNDCAVSICKECGEVCISCAKEYCTNCEVCGDCVEWTCTKNYDSCSKCLSEDGFCWECGACIKCTDLCMECGKCKECSPLCLDCSTCNDCVTQCPDCGLCEECLDGKPFCPECGYCSGCNETGGLCATCEMCIECAKNLGIWCDNCGQCFTCTDTEAPCPDCGYCDGCAPQCATCHTCKDCAAVCPDCGRYCSACTPEYLCFGCGTCFSCVDDVCPGCLLCISCADDYCSSCGTCSDCGTLCDECGEICADCAESAGKPFCGTCNTCIDCYPLLGPYACDNYAHEWLCRNPACDGVYKTEGHDLVTTTLGNSSFAGDGSRLVECTECGYEKTVILEAVTEIGANVQNYYGGANVTDVEPRLWLVEGTYLPRYCVLEEGGYGVSHWVCACNADGSVGEKLTSGTLDPNEKYWATGQFCAPAGYSFDGLTMEHLEVSSSRYEQITVEFDFDTGIATVWVCFKPSYRAVDEVSPTLDAPLVGALPDYDLVDGADSDMYEFFADYRFSNQGETKNGVAWYDYTDRKWVKPGEDTLQQGHEYEIRIAVKSVEYVYFEFYEDGTPETYFGLSCWDALEESYFWVEEASRDGELEVSALPGNAYKDNPEKYLQLRYRFPALEAYTPDAVEITGVTKPKAGAAPVFAAELVDGKGISIMEDYGPTNGVLWRDLTEDRYLDADDRFLPDHEYAVCVALEAAVGCRFPVSETTGKPAVSARINGTYAEDQVLAYYDAAGTYAAEEHIMVMYAFPKVTANPIKTFAITGIDEPVIGRRPDYTFLLNNRSVQAKTDLNSRKYNFKALNGVSWIEISNNGIQRLLDPLNNNHVFREDCMYVVLIHLKADEYSRFMLSRLGNYMLTVSVNGSSANTSVSQMCSIEANGGLVPGYTESNFDMSQYVTVARTYLQGSNYAIDVTGGEARRTEFGAAVSYAMEGSTVYLVPEVPEGQVFSHWEVVEGGMTVTEESGKYSFVMPKSAVEVRAVYRSKVTGLNVDMSGYRVGLTSSDMTVSVTSDEVDLTGFTLHGGTETQPAGNAWTGAVERDQVYWLRVEVTARQGYDLSSITCDGITLNGSQKADKLVSVEEGKAIFCFRLAEDVYDTVLSVHTTDTDCLVTVERLPEDLVGTVVVAQYSAAGQMKELQMLQIWQDRTMKFTGFTHVAGDVYEAFLVQKDQWIPLCSSAS